MRSCNRCGEPIPNERAVCSTCALRQDDEEHTPAAAVDRRTPIEKTNAARKGINILLGIAAFSILPVLFYLNLGPLGMLFGVGISVMVLMALIHLHT
jgi:uncharacterized membrane protein YvbJ